MKSFAYLVLASLIFVGSSVFAQDKVKPVEKKVEKTVAVKDTTAKKAKHLKKAVKKSAEKKAEEKKAEASK